MSKYRLSYYDNGVTNSIDLSKLDFFKDKDCYDIKYIDEFTMQFSDLRDLLSFLKINNVVDEDVKRVFITKDKRDKDSKIVNREKIYNGDYLLFKNSSVYFHMSYIYKYLTDNLENGEVIEQIVDSYYKKYFSRGIGPKYIENVLLSLKSLSKFVKNSGYSSLPNSEINEYVNNIDKFMIFEFYKYDYIPYKGEFVKRTDNDGNSIRNHINMRNFIINVILKNKKLNNISEVVSSKEKALDDEHEEFLTYEDFEMSDREIIDSYSNDEKDVNDEHYFRPNKRELKVEYKNISDELVNEVYRKR